jgi:hypothetical protein
MSSKLSITYYSSRENLGVISDEEYERFKNLLSEALQEEWPDAEITIDDDDEPSIDVSGVDADYAADVEGRVHDIVSELVESGDWEEAEDELYGDEDDLIEEEDEDEY